MEKRVQSPITLLSEPFAVIMLSISKRSLWARKKSGEITSVRIGRSVRFDARIPSFGSERREHVPLPVVASPGSEVSRGGLLQDRLVQFSLREKSFKSSVRVLKLYELFGLIDFQAAVFMPPAASKDSDSQLSGEAKPNPKPLMPDTPRHAAQQKSQTPLITAFGSECLGLSDPLIAAEGPNPDTRIMICLTS